MVSIETQAEMDLKENEVIDVKHPTLCWNSGRVSSIEKQGSKNVVNVKVNDLNLNFVFPSPEFENSIGKCGTKFKGNKCEVDNKAPNNPGKDMKKQTLECQSSRNGDCASNPIDCVFEDYELTDSKVECRGDMMLVKVDTTSRCKLLNCMNKCVKSF